MLRFPGWPWGIYPQSPCPLARVARFVELELDRMDDGGMYVWAAILAVLAIVGGVVVAVWWQRWRDEKKSRSSEISEVR